MTQRAFFAAILAFFLAAPYAALAADTCFECHTKPRYKKEDMQVLKECLACHGNAGHPYKNEARQGILSGGVAEAAEIKPVAAKKEAPKEAVIKGMVFIPEGEFLMGSDDRLRDEKPAYVAYAESFYIDKYEVTNEDYKKFADSAGRPAPDHWKGGNIPPGKAKHPVVFVTWQDAYDYCKWAGKKLPREMEWEKAARGTDGRIYPWGNEWNLNNSNNPLRGQGDTLPVGSFEKGKNQFGLYDMSGNVWEWVDDEYLPHPGSEYVSPEFTVRYKLLKGGSWWDCMFYGCGISAPTFNRSFFDTATKNSSFGFRCAADAGGQIKERK